MLRDFRKGISPHEKRFMRRSIINEELHHGLGRVSSLFLIKRQVRKVEILRHQMDLSIYKYKEMSSQYDN